MVGLLPEESEANVKNEDLPTLIWRNGMDNGSVVAVVGDYLKDSSASGLLDGMLAEASRLTRSPYPIVNAQNLSMVDFPVFADENSGEIQRLYSQRTTGMVRDIMWPSLDLYHGTERDENDLFCGTPGGLSGWDRAKWKQHGVLFKADEGAGGGGWSFPSV